jgi:diguanylate cyclase (GGDEF)-like protein
VTRLRGIGQIARENVRLPEWELWTHTTPWGIAWILVCELAVVAWALAAGLAAGWPTVPAWLLFTALAGAATLHIAFTRPAEERRRAAHLAGEHIDHTGIWTLAAALVLPAHLLTLLVLGIRANRYAIARKPPVRVLFGTAGILASALATQAISAATPVHGLLTGSYVPGSPALVVAAAGLVVAAVVAYYAVQTVILGVARWLRLGRWEWVAILGTRRQNVDLLLTMCLGLVAAWSANLAFGLLLLAVVVVAVGYTRHTQRIEALERDRTRLEVDALHDPLTGLPNRRGFDPDAQLALVTDQAQHRQSAVMMFDLDHFKAINTRLGHIAADQVLAAVAGAIRRQIRQGDLICRWGGEEIAMVLPGTGPADAAVVAERIRRVVEQLEVEVTEPSGGKKKVEKGFSISGGVAISPEDGVDLKPLQAVADVVLQQAKDNGRNQVVCTGAPPQPPDDEPGRAGAAPRTVRRREPPCR